MNTILYIFGEYLLSPLSHGHRHCVLSCVFVLSPEEIAGSSKGDTDKGTRRGQKSCVQNFEEKYIPRIVQDFGSRRSLESLTSRQTTLNTTKHRTLRSQYLKSVYHHLHNQFPQFVVKLLHLQ